MYLSELDLQYLINSIRTVCGKPVFIISLNWQVLASTHPDLISYANEILKDCIDTNDCKKAAERFGVLIEPCLIDQALVCYFFISDKKAASLLPYFKTIVQILVYPQISDLHSQISNSRSMLVNQLSNTSQKSLEIDSFMKEFDYSYTCPRCAVLFEISSDGSRAGNFKFDSSGSYLDGSLLHHPFYSKEDIYGFVSSERYLLFKDCSSFPEAERADGLRSYALSLSKEAFDSQGLTLHLGNGSIYTDLYDLRKSYLEALFLITNYDYLNTDKAPSLAINDFVFEYLAGLIPRRYWDSRFAGLSRSLEDSPALLETAIQLSRHNQNLTKAAESLGLHRNTMLQRFSKIKAITGLNPLQNDYDRMVLRTFALHVNQRITLQAGIVIQPNSVLHQGMKKMAELVNKNSNGAININIHTLSTSGNNHHLFEILRSGSIDMITAATGLMNKFTNNRTRVLEFPFLFSSTSEAKYILNTLIRKDVEAPLEAIGVKCLSIWSMGWRYLTSKEPVRVPQDMAGKKVRVMFTESLDEYYRSMGAIPVKMNYGDVGDALRSGIIDCQENPYSNILGMKFYEEQAYITRLKYYLSTEALYISRSAWEKLSPAHQEIIREAAGETTDWIFTEQQTVINQQCKHILVHEKGMKLLEITPEEANEWRGFSQSLYDAFPHQDLLHDIEKARKDYHAKFRNDPPAAGI